MKDSFSCASVAEKALSVRLMSVKMLTFAAKQKQNNISIMANRKTLKKVIAGISNELLTDCVAIGMVGDADQEKLSALAARVLAMEKEYIARVNHTEPGSVRLFYKKLREDFTQEANQLAAEIAKL